MSPLDVPFGVFMVLAGAGIFLAIIAYGALGELISRARRRR